MLFTWILFGGSGLAFINLVVFWSPSWDMDPGDLVVFWGPSWGTGPGDLVLASSETAGKGFQSW